MNVVTKQFDNAKRWSSVLQPFREREVAILEVGSWVGGSAAVFLEMLPLARITCIDPFDGKFLGNPGQECEFDAKMAPFGSRVEKIKSRSFAALDALAQNGRRFDIIYIDGSHTRDDTLMDSLLAWRLLAQSGLMIWDDYVWEMGRLPTEQRPKDGIDLFLAWYRDKLTIVEKGYQIIARKATSAAEVSSDWSEGFIYARTPRNLFRFLAGRPLDRPRHGH